jgi:flagellin
MAISVNSSLGAQQIYNAMQKSQASTQAAQLRLATGSKVNSAADNTSGWNVGVQLQAASLNMKSELANIGDAQNFLSTAESALQQVYDKLNTIASKQADSADPLKDASSLQNDIATAASEISTILSNTKINGNDLLASASASFGAGASNVTVNIGAKLNMSTNQTALTALTAGGAGSLTTDITAFQSSVRSAITYVGNQTQTLDSRSQYLTSAISNNDASVAQIFSTDTVGDQITNSQGQVTNQLATSMLAQMNSSPQQLMRLFQ